MVVQIGPVSYKVQTQDNVIWDIHAGQRLSSVKLDEKPLQVETPEYSPDIYLSQEPFPEDPLPEQNAMCPPPPDTVPELHKSSSHQLSLLSLIQF